MNTNYVEIWKNCLKIIRDNVTPTSFKTWFEPIVPLKLEKQILTIQVPSHFFYEYIEETYIDLLRMVIRKELGTEAKLEYNIIVANEKKEGTVVIPSSVTANTKNRPLDKSEQKGNNVQDPFVIPGIKTLQVDSHLNQLYCFENLIVGDCNRLAYSAGMSIAKNPGGTSFNPLFIHSKPGLGKTHIAQAIGLETKKLLPEKTVLYVSANKFKTQYTESVRNNNINDFIHFYQMIDLLIVDDIQELAGKAKTQAVFFHIFNHLHQTGKQLILTSDRPPIELDGMEERLLSRFKWGLSADLLVPSFEVRKEIFEYKAHKEGLQISNEVVDYVCENVQTNIRELEGILVSLIAHATINNQEVTLNLAEKVVSQFVKHQQVEITIPRIKQIVSDYFNITVEDIGQKTRRREIVQARQIAMYFSKSLTKSSLASIGAQIGNKDHATVLHACKAVNNMIDTNKKYRLQIEDLSKLIKAN